MVVNDDGSIVSSESDQFKNRLELKGNFANKRRIDATLMINDFMKQDEGDFKCEVAGAVRLDREVTIRAVGKIYVLYYTYDTILINSLQKLYEIRLI